MFKVGDMVTLIDGLPDFYAHVRINGKYKVMKINNGVMILNNIDNENLCANGHWYAQQDFKLLKDKPTTEIDYLDCFQSNFKDGI